MARLEGRVGCVGVLCTASGTTLLQEHINSATEMYLLGCCALSKILGAAGQSSQKPNDPAAVES